MVGWLAQLTTNTLRSLPLTHVMRTVVLAACSRSLVGTGQPQRASRGIGPPIRPVWAGRFEEGRRALLLLVRVLLCWLLAGGKVSSRRRGSWRGGCATATNISDTTKIHPASRGTHDDETDTPRRRARASAVGSVFEPPPRDAWHHCRVPRMDGVMYVVMYVSKNGRRAE